MVKIGFKHTEETKKKMSEIRKKSYREATFKGGFKKGQKGYVKKGWHHSEETKEKMSRAAKGKPKSEKAKIKMSESGKLRIGAKNPFYGRSHSKESRIKMRKAHKGKHIGNKNNNWKGGITPLFFKIRNSVEYSIWRTKVFERDNYTCQGKNHNKSMPRRSGEGKKIILEAHHKKSVSKIFQDNNILIFEEALSCRELWDVDNGITLCKECHKLTSNYKGKGHGPIKHK